MEQSGQNSHEKSIMSRQPCRPWKERIEQSGQNKHGKSLMTRQPCRPWKERTEQKGRNSHGNSYYEQTAMSAMQRKRTEQPGQPLKYSQEKRITLK
jgi:hypothetical protein